VGQVPSSPVSKLLIHWGNGDRKALEAILPLVYNELRRLARYHLRQQRPNHTLQTTALVHEAYLRLAQEKAPHAENRATFWALPRSSCAGFLWTMSATGALPSAELELLD